MLSLETMTISEIALPNTNTATVAGIGMGMGMGAAFSGLGGYMSLGLGAKEKKPCIVRVDDGEVLIPKDSKSSKILAVYYLVTFKFQTPGFLSVPMASPHDHLELIGPEYPKRMV